MLFIRRLTVLVAVAGSVVLALAPAEAGRRGSFAHHSQVKVWHGNRVGNWSHHGHWPRHTWHGHWHGSAPRWNAGWNSAWGWSRTNGYSHRWWSWNSRRHPHFASRRHARHAMHRWGHGSHDSHWSNQQRRPGVWYASPGFGSSAARGPVRQGEWHAD
jgi:hypothetical protein